MADILFLVPNKELSIAQEINGTLLLATKLLEAGIDTDVLRFCQVEGYHGEYDTFLQNITDRIVAIEPKCVSFYTLWPYYHVILRIAQVLKTKAPQISIILGGPQASATAQATIQAMPFVDYICTGEGENTVVPFFQALLEGNEQALTQIPGLWYRKEGQIIATGGDTPISDLDTLPRWDDRLYLPLYATPEPTLHSKIYFMPIDAGRGCPYSCTFCCTSHFWRRTYRLKSPERIVADIRYFNEKFGIRSFWFSHDAFTTRKQLVAQVCDYILEAGLDINWKCSARIDCISQDLILKMKQAGMTHIELGIETGSVRMQKLINKHLDLKRAREMVQFMLDNGIYVSLFFMYGFPEETEADLADTVTMLLDLVDLGVDQVSLFFCKFNPTTAITEKYFDQLVFDPSITMISRGIYGFDQEEQMIRENKAIFPCFYHLETPLRRNYHFLHYFAFLYQEQRESMMLIRRLYGGDDLRFYRDFYRNNQSWFQNGNDLLMNHILKTPTDMMVNTIRDLDHPCAPQLMGLLAFLRDLKAVTESASDTSMVQAYSFDYRDYQAKKPIEDYAPATSQLLICKLNGAVRVRPLAIR